jgi:hypothetical protein
MTVQKIKLAYVQAQDGVPSNEAFYKAWDGFRKRGIPCELFDPAQIYERSITLTTETLVAGALRVVEAAMVAIGMTVPTADNLPECLARYRGRKIYRSTWGKLRTQYGADGPEEPLFVKPLLRNKGFPSIALFNSEDMSALQVDDHDEVLVAEYVVFESEWRCFVCHNQILNLSHYQGDCLKFLDSQVVTAAIADYGPLAPAAYGIDFGVLTDGRTVLVEVNDSYSLGSYGLNCVEYAEMLEARWLQLAGAANVSETDH